MEANLNSASALAALIDHTSLKPEAVKNDIEALCDEARRFQFASVCINPCWVPLASEKLADSRVKVCTVIGFPLGAERKQTKEFAARRALDDGAKELDMVLNIGQLRSGDLESVESEIASLAAIAHSGGAILKVILETCLLNTDQKGVVCQIAVASQADFVKTSTGFSNAGATTEDVRLMRQTVGEKLGVKASGGIRTLAVLREMVSAGATRIGTSSGVKIIQEYTAGAQDSQGTRAEQESLTANTANDKY